MLPFELRNASDLFQLELAERSLAASHSTKFVGAADYTPTSIHDLLDASSCGEGSESDTSAAATLPASATWCMPREGRPQRPRVPGARRL